MGRCEVSVKKWVEDVSGECGGEVLGECRRCRVSVEDVGEV